MSVSSTKAIEDIGVKVDRLFSFIEAKKLLGISDWTLRKWAADGKIRTCKLGSRRLIPLSEIERLIASSMTSDM